MKAACLITAAVALSVSTLAQTWVQWPVSEGGSGHWYGLTKHEHRGWGQAEAEAQTHPNGHLVSINSLPEQKFLEATFLSGHSVSDAYWIGFNDFVKEGEWTWSTGEPVTFTYWHQGEPNNASSSEDGVIMNWEYSLNDGGFGDWNDYFENTRTYRGIVEIQDAYPPVEVEVVPWSQTVPPGSTAEFRAYTYGLGTTIEYRWQFNGTDIPGATNQTFVLSNLLRNQSGEYSVVAVLPGPDLLSQAAKLRVVGAPLLVSQPASRVVSEGGTTDFTVTVDGEGPFTYEWLFNGVPIPNATQPTLPLSNIKSTQTGSYSAHVSNTDGSISSSPAKLTVIPPGFTVVYGNDFEGAVGDEWSKRNTTVTPVGGRRHLGPFETGSIRLTLPEVAAGSELLLVFDLYLLNTWDGNNPSPAHGPDVWLLRASGGHELVKATFSAMDYGQSYPATAGEADFPRFTGAVERGTLTTSFLHIPETTMDCVYGLRFLVPHDAGSAVFTFEAPGLESLDNESWGLDNVVVAVGTIPPGSPPEIVQVPASQVVRQGETAVFKVLASGPPPLRYQWRFSGGDILGATNDFLAVSAATASSAGRYSVVVENDYGLISRSPANLAVVTSEPSGQTVNKGDPVFFTLELSGDAGIQWRFNGLDLPGQTNGTLQLGTAQSDHAGRYTVLITNGGKPFETAAAHLAVPLPTEPGDKLWEFDTGSSPYGVMGSPALGADGTVYVGTVSGELMALSSDGVQLWRVGIGPIFGSPAVGADGTVIIGAGSSVHAVSPAGQLLWSKALEGGGYMQTSPAIAADGTIYAAAINPGTLLHALRTDGTEKWRFDAGARIYASPAIGADGTIYFGTLDNSALFFAIRPDGTELWRRSARANWAYASPAIAADGTVFFSSDRVYALDRGGTTLWEFPSADMFVGSGAINAQGDMLQADLAGLLHVVSHEGMLVRSVDLGARVLYSPGVAISDQGTAYVFGDDLRLHAVSATGEILWSFATGGRLTLSTPHARPSPTLAPDGTIYLGGLDGKLYAIKGDGPPAPSSWPVFRHDAQHTGRIPLLLEAANLNVSVGANVTLRAVTGESDAKFQWRHNGKPLLNETNGVLNLNQVTLAQAGEYDVVMSYGGGTARSHAAVLEVDAAFTKITADPIATDSGESIGIAWGDYDGDGWQDLFVANDNMQTNFLYHNERDGTFARNTDAAPVLDEATHTGGAWGDYDNDGRLDLFVARWKTTNALYRRDWTDGFISVTGGSIVSDVGAFHGAAWGDFDNDGNLDLAVCDLEERCFLYRNSGDGTFSRMVSGVVPNEIGILITPSWADYDNDGDLDLFVAVAGAEHTSRNLLFRNDRFQFTKITSGPVTTDIGSSQAGSWADYDNDGDLDLLVTSPGEALRLYRNEGNGIFLGPVANVFEGGSVHAASSAWGDFDNDGLLDLFLATADDSSNVLYRNNGNGTFRRWTQGSLVNDRRHSWSCAWADYDNNGFLDLVVGNRHEENSLYRNNGTGNRWLKVRLIGTRSNASGIGAKVRIKAQVFGQEMWQLREVSGGTGFCAQNALDAHFGLGDAMLVEILRIEWPSGIVQEFGDVAANQFLTITEPPVLTPLGLWPGGGFEMILTSRGGFDYAIEATENLANWTTIGTLRAVNGSVQFVDSQARSSTKRFYRAVKL